MRVLKFLSLILVLLMPVSCSNPADSSEAKTTMQDISVRTDMELLQENSVQDIGYYECETAENFFFFDGLELGTKYADMGKVINPEGIFGELAYDEWDDTELADYPGSVSSNMSSNARTSENDTVTGELLFGRHDYFDGISLLGVDVILEMDETQPDLDGVYCEKKRNVS